MPPVTGGGRGSVASLEPTDHGQRDDLLAVTLAALRGSGRDDAALVAAIEAVAEARRELDAQMFEADAAHREWQRTFSERRADADDSFRANELLASLRGPRNMLQYQYLLGGGQPPEPIARVEPAAPPAADAPAGGGYTGDPEPEGDPLLTGQEPKEPAGENGDGDGYTGDPEPEGDPLLTGQEPERDPALYGPGSAYDMERRYGLYVAAGGGNSFAWWLNNGQPQGPTLAAGDTGPTGDPQDGDAPLDYTPTEGPAPPTIEGALRSILEDRLRERHGRNLAPNPLLTDNQLPGTPRVTPEPGERGVDFPPRRQTVAPEPGERGVDFPPPRSGGLDLDFSRLLDKPQRPRGRTRQPIDRNLEELFMGEGGELREGDMAIVGDDPTGQGLESREILSVMDDGTIQIRPIGGPGPDVQQLGYGGKKKLPEMGYGGVVDARGTLNDVISRDRFSRQQHADQPGFRFLRGEEPQRAADIYSPQEIFGGESLTQLPGTDRTLPYGRGLNLQRFLQLAPSQQQAVVGATEAPRELGGLGALFEDSIELARRHAPRGSYFGPTALVGNYR